MQWEPLKVTSILKLLVNVRNDVPNRSLFQLPILLEKLNSKNFKLKVENWK